MARDTIPLEIFVTKALVSPRVAPVTAEWRIDPRDFVEFFVKKIREMGVFSIPENHVRMMEDNIIHILKNSVELHAMVKEAERQEKIRQAARAAR
jgi:hypothetical protein